LGIFKAENALEATDSDLRLQIAQEKWRNTGRMHCEILSESNQATLEVRCHGQFQLPLGLQRFSTASKTASRGVVAELWLSTGWVVNQAAGGLTSLQKYAIYQVLAA